MVQYYETSKIKTTRFLLCLLNWGHSANRGSDYDNKVYKRLKLKNIIEANCIRSCLDLIEDTEFAILCYCEYGLCKVDLGDINKDYKEIYLKLYGILNAVYLQSNALFELFEYMNTKNKKEKISIVKGLDVYDLRNIAGSHTVNYDDARNKFDSKGFKNTFKIIQCDLNHQGSRINAVSDNFKLKKYNLYELIMEYNRVFEKIFYESICEYCNLILPHGSKEIDEWMIENKILEFEYFDYRSLYQNDKIMDKWHKRIRRKLLK